MNGKGYYLFRTLQGIIEEVDLRKVRRSSFGYRDHSNYDQRHRHDGALLALRDSIQEKGLLQPITVRVKDGFYEVVIGNRRYEACKLLGLRKVLCNIVELDDRQAFETSLIENMQRKDLNPIEEAKAFKVYVNRYGRGSISDLARTIGRSVAYVDKRTRLLELPSEVIDMISVSDISISVAEELLPINKQQKRCELAKTARDEKLSLKEVRALAANSADVTRSLDATTYSQRDRWQFETKIADLDKNAQKSYDKAIVAMRTAMNKIISIMDNIEENWIVHEMLRQHKEALHNQIDLLIREKQRI